MLWFPLCVLNSPIKSECRAGGGKRIHETLDTSRLTPIKTESQVCACMLVLSLPLSSCPTLVCGPGHALYHPGPCFLFFLFWKFSDGCRWSTPCNHNHHKGRSSYNIDFSWGNVAGLPTSGTGPGGCPQAFLAERSLSTGWDWHKTMHHVKWGHINKPELMLF